MGSVLTADGLVIPAGFAGLVALVAILVLVLSVRARRDGLAPDLSDLLVLVVDARRVVAASVAARRAGVVPGRSVDDALERVIGPSAELSESIAGMARSGAEGVLSCIGRDGRPWLVEAELRGARMRLLLRAGHRARSPAVPPRSEPPPPGPEAMALIAALAGTGTAAVWQRDPVRGLLWSEGRISLRETTVDAAQAVGMIIARTRIHPDTPGTEAISRLRLDLPHGERGDTLSLATVEVPGPGGTRFGIAVDGTATATAERTLGRFVQTMTETFAHLAVGLAIFDRNRTLALFNPALAQMWQADPGWLARRPGWREILDHLRTTRRIPEVTDYRSWRQRLLDLFEEPEAADHEELWDLPDGSSIRVMARPHPHGSLAFVFDDVTERLRLQQQNRQINDLIRSTLERLDEALAVFTPNGRLQFVNQAFHEVWGTDPGTAGPPAHIRDICELCSRQSVETEIWSRLQFFVTAEEDRRAWTARVSLGSGRVLWGRVAPLPDGSTMVAFADITDSERIALALKERNEALETAEEMRVAVLDNISHRLRTPLNTVLGFAQLLTNPRLGELGERQMGYASGILEAAGNLLDTIGDVTELAALEIDPLHHDTGRIDVAELLATMANLLDKRATESRVSLSLSDGVAGLGVTLGDGARLRQIVFNLTADAIGRCPPGGRVELGARLGTEGEVTILTRQTDPGGDGNPIERAEAASLSISLLRRMVAREGGRLLLEHDARAGEMVTACRLPAHPATADLPGPQLRTPTIFPTAGPQRHGPAAAPTGSGAPSAPAPVATPDATPPAEPAEEPPAPETQGGPPPLKTQRS